MACGGNAAAAGNHIVIQRPIGRDPKAIGINTEECAASDVDSTAIGEINEIEHVGISPMVARIKRQRKRTRDRQIRSVDSYRTAGGDKVRNIDVIGDGAEIEYVYWHNSYNGGIEDQD